MRQPGAIAAALAERLAEHPEFTPPLISAHEVLARLQPHLVRPSILDELRRMGYFEVLRTPDRS